MSSPASTDRWLPEPLWSRLFASVIFHAQARRRLAAVLMADVVGYTRLTGVDKAGTRACLKVIGRESRQS
jgi:class 3 adenylate cyclase